ncbi:MAG: flagellar basal body L-ring protein FlgH [Rickettsiales bacterium]|jgi:flagellar L-ring protein precursor FlgH|nr:flagellar basal body L-ring protein FlgH [Rickettsiales bacterium]
MLQSINKGVYLLLTASALTACTSTLDKLDNINKPPPFTEVVNPQEKPDYKPLSWPMPETPPPAKQYANSLWQPGARAFYRDQRAARVGDILRINISIDDKAEVDNQTQANRTTGETVGAPSVMGFENLLAGNVRIPPLGLDGIPLKDRANPASLLDISGSTNTQGTAAVKRKEKIDTQIAALITQVLPNGNFVIDGSQEILINKEIRELTVRGVIRPQDIKSDNTIDSTQIAEARITYGGRGQLSDVQRGRWGSQVVDALAPF